jgi:DNA-binding transcriptional ArsR family regulator
MFKAVADATRRTILDELIDRDGQTLFELCTRLAMNHQVTSSRQAISQHLDCLESAGLITTRRQGRASSTTSTPHPCEPSSSDGR